MDKKNLFLNLFIAILYALIFSLSAVSSFLALDILKPNLDLEVQSPDLGFLNSLKSKIPKFYIVQSGSMEPAIKTGSIVVVIPSQNYAQGDIISFKKGKNIITHRIYAKTFNQDENLEPLYLTAGDANEEFDAWKVKNEEIVGKVIVSIPYLGYIANFGKTPQGFILLVIVPATIIVYEEIKAIISQIRCLLSKFFLNPNFTPRLSSENFGLPFYTILIPFFGAFAIVGVLTTSYFLDIESSIGNILGAREVFNSTNNLDIQSQSININENFQPSPSVSISSDEQNPPNPTPSELSDLTPTPTSGPQETQENINESGI